jgi:hypothetical protein
MQEMAMSCDADLRQPYGPGWEDPDWRAQASSTDVPAEVCDAAIPATLAEFMEGLRRVAGPQGAANAKRIEAGPRRRAPVSPGQTRRWVVASGASLLAAGTFALPRPARPPEAAARSAPASTSPARTAPREKSRFDDDSTSKRR